MRRILITVLFIAAIFGLSLSVRADNEVLVYEKSGYEGTESEIFAPSSSENIKILGFSVSDVSGFGDAEKPYRRISHRIMTTNLPIAKNDEGHAPSGSASIAIDYEKYAHPLNDYTSLCFGVWFRYADESVIADHVISAILTTAEGDSYTWDFTAPSDSASLVTVDMRGLEGTISDLTLSLRYDDETAPDAMVLSAPYVCREDDPIFASADRFSASRLTASVGMIAASIGRVRPDDGSAVISGEMLTTVFPKKGTRAYLAVTLSGIESGVMSTGISFVGTTSEQRYYTKKITLPDSSQSAQTVLFPIDMLDTVESYHLYFSDIASDSRFMIESVRLLEGADVPFDGNYGIGSVTALTRGTNFVYFEGSMERDVIRNLRGESIGFYAIPASTADDLTTAYLLGSVNVSTDFSFSADFSSMSGMLDTFMFFAAIRGKNDDGSALLMPLSKPRYPDASALPESKVSIVGLSDAASVGVFEANVSNVTITVDLCELITASDNGVALSYIDYDTDRSAVRRINLSRELLSSLDSEIQFYISSGTKVFLRLTASSPIKGLTYSGNADCYLPDLSTDGARYYWAAVIHYLSERYSGISGYIIGKSVNCAADVSYSAFMTAGELDLGKLTSYAASLAELTRITYTAASIYISDAPVILPLVPSQTNQSGIPAVSLALLLSERFSQTGTIPWVLQWCMTSFGSENDVDFEEITALRHCLEELEVQLPAAYMFSLSPDSNALAESYNAYVSLAAEQKLTYPDYGVYSADIFREFYEKCTSNRARAAFVSLEKHQLRQDHSLYSAIKNISLSGRFVYETEAASGESSSEYRYTLFDFSDKHYPLGWIAGGGVSSCLTETSPLFKDSEGRESRVLRTEFSTDTEFEDASGSAGITLRNLSKRYNFSEIDTVEFTLALTPISESVSGGKTTVVMMIGNDDYRSEYYASDVSAGEIHTLTCDLTEYPYRNTVDYIGIMVYSDSPVYLDLSKVRVGSDTMTEEELSETFSSSEEEPIPDLKKAGLVIALAAMLGIGALVALTHHDREEDEKREAALLEASKHRRTRK